MRVLVWLTLLAVPAFAAPRSGSARIDGVPAANATVHAFDPSPAEFPGCPRDPKGGALGRCLCPEQQAAFGARLIQGVEATRTPIATTTTAADGTFTLDVANPKAVIEITSADGAWAAEGSLEKPDLALAPQKPVRLRFTGLTKNLAAYVVGMFGGRVERLALRDGLWVSRPVGPAVRFLVVAAEGAQPQMQMLWDGKTAASAFAGFGAEPNEVSTVELAAALPLRGTVTEDGRPVADVEVLADPENCAIATRTDGKGEFTVPSSNARPYLTTVIARTKTKRAQQTVAAGATVELALRPSARLELTLVDAAGKPVPNEALRVGGETLRSDAAGKISTEVVAREVAFEVDAPWLRVRDSGPFALKGTVTKKLVLERAAILTGRLVDPHGGKPRKASVEARPVGNDDLFARKTGWSDDTGAFTITGLAPGRYRVAVLGDDATQVEATAPGEVELKAEVAHTLAGRVADPSGKPVAGASLSARMKDSNHSFGDRTGPNGEFRMPVGGPGLYELTAAHGANRKTVPVEVGVEASTPVKLALVASPPLKGKVVDATGKPVAGALVEGLLSGMPHLRVGPGTNPSAMVMMAKASRTYGSAVSAADGAFELPLYGDAQLFIGAGVMGAGPVAATVGTPVTLVVARRPTATGRVVDAGRRPVGHFFVNGLEFFDADGRYALPLFTTGEFVLTVSNGTSPDEKWTVSLSPDAQNIEVPEIVLRRGFSVSGRATNAVTGKPAKGTVTVFGAGNPPIELGRAAIQSDGSFQLGKLDEGPLRLKFESQDQVTAEVDAKAGQADLVVKLVPKAGLEVMVRKGREAGKGVEVVLAPVGGGPSRTARADSDGRAIFQRLDPGTYSAATLEYGNQGPIKRVVLKPGATAKLDLSTQ